MKLEQEITCPCLIAQRLIQGKWAIIIMYYLSLGPTRFNELQRKLPKMTHATLSNQLKQLEAEGLIHRKEYAQIPPKVEYSLTERGESLMNVLDQLCIWGSQNRLPQ